tara:strand:+ start:743 stop:952 length:210 start_codon:yes stop_codon:yes gene_type:complete
MGKAALNIGDLVMFCDSLSKAIPAILVRIVPDTLPGGEIHGAVVLSKLGQHWIRLDRLAPVLDQEGGSK